MAGDQRIGAAMKTRRTASSTAALKVRGIVPLGVGDWVLIGAPGISMPGDWFHAQVIWFDDEEVLTAHTPPSGMGTQRNLSSRSQIRMAGDYVALTEFQERCRKEVADLRAKVNEAERALGAARDAVWKRLDEIAEQREIRT